MFVYYSANQVKNQDFKGPDFFVVLDVDGTRNRDAWIAWEEDSRLPDVVIELMSPSTAEVDLTTKKDIYERKLKTQDYFVYNPKNPNSLRGWELINRRYQSLSPNQQGRFYCESLGLWLGAWEGEIENSQGNWLRFFDADGNLILMRDEAETKRAELERQQKEEAIQQLKIEKQQKEKLATKLRELGINPDEI